MAYCVVRRPLTASWSFLFLFFFSLLPSAFAQGDQPSPWREVQDIFSRLQKVERLLNDDSLEGVLVEFTEIGSMLDVFELQFGQSPQKISEWQQVNEKARELLETFEKLIKKDLVYFNADSSRISHAVLLEIAGKPEAALAEIRAIEPGGGCGNWTSTVMMAAREREAGILQRMGKNTEALAAMKAAREEGKLSLYSPAPDLAAVRYAFLLNSNGEGDASVAEYQRILDLYPKTTGARLARTALEKKGRLIEPSADRIKSLYLDSSPAQDFDEAVFSLAANKFPEAYAILAEQLASADQWKRNRIIPALGVLEDRAAIPLLKKAMETGTDANRRHAVLALHRCGDDSEVLPWLRDLHKSEDGEEKDFSREDSTLKEIYSDGPEFGDSYDDQQMKDREFAEIWLTWLNEKGLAGIGKTPLDEG